MVVHLQEILSALSYDLVVFSGDFTQIANEEEFLKAQKFIKTLNAPILSVPGNHDIPRYDFFERLLYPYRKYRAYINNDLCPVFENNFVSMVGLNTARRILPHWNWAHGAISEAQLHFLEKAWKQAGRKLKICVMHHPIQKAEKSPLKVIVYGAKRAMQKIHELQADLVLTGHVHHASITVVQKTVFASASTAISSRTRSQSNGFNVIDIKDTGFEITHYHCENDRFVIASNRQFTKNS